MRWSSPRGAIGRCRGTEGGRVLALIALNAVPARVLAELESEGRTPRLTELRQGASAVELSTPAALFPAGVFPTLWSGVPLAEHGLHYPFMWDAGSQRVRSIEGFAPPTMMWDRVSEAGGRVLVVDPYESSKSRSVDGLVISGWQFANRIVLRPSSLPAGARRRWERRLGSGGRGEEVFGEPDERSLRRLVGTLTAAPKRVADLVLAALPEIRPDLLVVDFPAIHLAGHQFWDPAAVVGGISTTSARELHEALRDVIVEADTALGRVVDALPPGADVVVFSPLGMDADTSRTDVLGVLLAAVLDDARLARASAGGAWGFRASVPASVRARIAGALPDRVAIEIAARLELRGTDWSRTRAFSLPSDTSGLVRFNVQGRERDGIVAPGDVAALVAEIRAGLESFAFEDGAPVVTCVDVVADTFGGAAGSHLLPDLVVQWNDRPARRGELLHSAEFGAIRRDGPGSGRSGNHTTDAWALTLSATGRAKRQSLGDVTDIAATALARFGIESAGDSLIEIA